MTPSFWIAMVGVAAMLAVVAIVLAGYEKIDIGGLVAVALLSIIASCVATVS